MAERKQRGFSLIELLVVVAIILIIAAIAIPNLLSARMRASESSAVQSLRTLNSSQMAYNNLYNSYAPNMLALGPGSPCDQTHSCMVDEVLGCTPEPCLKAGYNFYMASDSPSPPIADFVFTATPLVWQRTGAKNFCTIDDGTLRFQVDATASLPGAVSHDECLKLAVYESI